MQVKVCPKCKAENRPGNAACSSCYTPLEAVAVTESAAPAPVRPPAAPAAPRPPRALAAPAPTQQMPPAQQTQMGTMAPPPGMPAQSEQFQMMPVPKRRSSPGLIVAVVFICVAVVGGLMAFAISKSGLLAPEPLPTQPPEQTVLKFLEAKRSGSLIKVEPYLSLRSREIIHKTYSSRQFQSAGFSEKDAADMYIFNADPTAKDMENKTITASVSKSDPEADERMRIVNVIVDKGPEPAAAPQRLLPPGVTPPPSQTEGAKLDISSLLDRGPIEAEFVVIAEKGEWKIDIEQATRRRLGLGKPGNPFKLGK